MKRLLLAAALSACVWPTGSLAVDPPAPGDRPGETAAVPQPAEAPSLSSPETENAPAVLKGKRIDLENGDYVIVVDDPDPKAVETRAWFDEEGKAHIRCDH